MFPPEPHLSYISFGAAESITEPPQDLEYEQEENIPPTPPAEELQDTEMDTAPMIAVPLSESMDTSMPASEMKETTNGA